VLFDHGRSCSFASAERALRIAFDELDATAERRRGRICYGEAGAVSSARDVMPRPLAFTRAMRLVHRNDFARVFRQGRRARGAIVVVVVLENELAHSRLGLSVGRAIWKSAVKRNRVRRIFREAFRLAYPELPRGVDVVMIPAAPKLDPELAPTRAELLVLVARALATQRSRTARGAARLVRGEPEGARGKAGPARDGANVSRDEARPARDDERRARRSPKESSSRRERAVGSRDAESNTGSHTESAADAIAMPIADQSADLDVARARLERVERTAEEIARDRRRAP
jgi:ribonuclease P protein component